MIDHLEAVVKYILTNQMYWNNICLSGDDKKSFHLFGKKNQCAFVRVRAEVIPRVNLKKSFCIKG